MVKEFSADILTKEPNQIEMLLKACSEALSAKNKPIILFGAGMIGEYYSELIKDKLNTEKEILFCDNNPAKFGTIINGVPVISFDELKNDYRDSYIIITALKYCNDLILQLKENGLSPLLDPLTYNIFVGDTAFYETYADYPRVIQENINKFEQAYELLQDEYSRRIFIDRLNYCISADTRYLTPFISDSPQYFEKEIISLSGDEIFIDGGSYIGDTLEEFLRQTNGRLGQAYCFEPEKTKHKEFLSKFSALKNVELIPYGLWSRNDELSFNAIGTGSSSISQCGTVKIQVTSIDEILQGAPATFIKMDIEGAELEALKGAENVIRKHRPKLGICVYHKPLDIAEIPLYIKELLPEYKIYLRHYNYGASETVCYAVADQTIGKGKMQYEY